MDDSEWPWLVMVVLAFLLGSGVGACSYDMWTASDECAEDCTLYEAPGLLVEGDCYCKTSPPQSLDSLLAGSQPTTAEAP